jgi:hypothetical protein
MSVRLLTSFSGWHIRHLINGESLSSPVTETLNYHASNKIVPQLSHISFVINVPVLVTTLIFVSSFLNEILCNIFQIVPSHQTILCMSYILINS